MHLNCMLSPFLPTVATDVVAQRMFQKGCCLLPRQDAQCELGQKNEVGGMFFCKQLQQGAFSSQGRMLNVNCQKKTRLREQVSAGVLSPAKAGGSI